VQRPILKLKNPRTPKKSRCARPVSPDELGKAAGVRRRKQAKTYLKSIPVIQNMLPMAIGCGKEIIAGAPFQCRKHVRILIHQHVSSAKYVRLLAVDEAQRHDINGLEVEPVNDEHRAIAVARLKAQGGNGDLE
jgi:RNA chaperone ProQ/FINO-like protein